MKKIFLIICLGMALLGMTGGCSVTKMDGEDMTAIDYEIISREEIPGELLKLIEDKNEKDFQLTYQDEDSLYLVRGYGRQSTGGYSIQVEDLSMGESYINLTTNLLGPSGEEEKLEEPSYPYIVIKIKYRDMPVQFQ